MRAKFQFSSQTPTKSPELLACREMLYLRHNKQVEQHKLKSLSVGVL